MKTLVKRIQINRADVQLGMLILIFIQIFMQTHDNRLNSIWTESSWNTLTLYSVVKDFCLLEICGVGLMLLE